MIAVNPVQARILGALRRSGDEAPAIRRRFWAKVDKAGPVPVTAPELGPCWVWRAGKYASGYGQFMVYGTGVKSHALSFLLVRGLMGLDQQHDHLCENKVCCNPYHIKPSTAWENTLKNSSPHSKNARKTHCDNGHLLAGDNLFTYKPSVRYPNGRRYCRQCRRDSEMKMADLRNPDRKRQPKLAKTYSV